jgi:putative transposase
VLKRLHYPLDVILTCVRWYVAFSAEPASSGRNDVRAWDRSGSFDGTSLGHEAVAVVRESISQPQTHGGKSWRMDETYIKVKGQWKYLYRALDKDGNTVDFLLRARRDRLAARRYFEKSIAHHGAPETVTIDQSGANLTALKAINAERVTPIKIRQSKYLNNIVEQDHRAIKRRTRPMLGFKKFGCARILLNGIELMHMINKGQMKNYGLTAQQFYALVA